MCDQCKAIAAENEELKRIIIQTLADMRETQMALERIRDDLKEVRHNIAFVGRGVSK